MSAAAVLAWLWTTSWQVALLVAVVLLAERVLGRWLAPRWRHALWCVVLVRLFLPVQPEVPTLALNWTAAGDRIALRHTAGPRAPRKRTPDAPRPATTVDEPSEAADPAATTAAPSVVANGAENPSSSRSSNDLLARCASSARTAGELSLPGAPFEPPPPAELTRETPARTPAWALALVALWALVALSLLARDLWIELAFRRRLARAPEVRDPEVLRLFASSCERVGIARPVRLVCTDLVSAPALYGMLHPRILLPGHVLAGFREPELRHVFLHELAHLKRGDVLLGVGLVLARRLYWFHPLVRLAAGRLRAAQESARDWEALALAQDSGPLPYARTLLRLIEERGSARAATPQTARSLVGNAFDGRKALKTRFQMITRFENPRRATAFLGGGLVLALAWAALLTSAVDPPPALSDSAEEHALFDATAAGPETQMQSIRVERQSVPPAWRAALEKKLDATTVFGLNGATLRDALEFLRRTAGINVVTSDELAADYADRKVWLLGELTLRQGLDLIARQLPEAGWCLSRHAVYLGYGYDLPLAMELRFYNIEPLIGSEESPDDGVDDVIAMVQDLTYGDGIWDLESATIDYWRGLLVVNHTPEVHAEVEAILNRMLRRGRRAETPEPAWRSRLGAVLAQTIDLSIDGESPEAIARRLGALYGIPMVCPPDLADGEEISLELSDVTFASALDWVADVAGIAIYLADGAVVFDEVPPLDVEFFEVTDLVAARSEQEDWEVADGLDSLIRVNVGRDSWDSRPECCIRFWKGLLVVRQSRAVLDGVGDLLAAAQRATTP